MIECQQLSQPTNGAVVVTGREAVYTCNEGYQLVGFATITCHTDGIWSPQQPTCERKFYNLKCMHHYFLPDLQQYGVQFCSTLQMGGCSLAVHMWVPQQTIHVSLAIVSRES